MEELFDARQKMALMNFRVIAGVFVKVGNKQLERGHRMAQAIRKFRSRRNNWLELCGIAFQQNAGSKSCERSLGIHAGQ
jgi:hypothetical protein